MIRNAALALLLFAPQNDGCSGPPTSDDIQQGQQETLLKEATSAVGMPAITHWRERKLLKTILELRDQENLSTFTYVWSDYHGKFIFYCNSIGYGVPYATQYTNPQKVELRASASHYSYVTLPQADPNGLFSPAAAEGTWVMCKDPRSDKVSPMYVEPRITVSTFELSDALVLREPAKK